MLQFIRKLFKTVTLPLLFYITAIPVVHAAVSTTGCVNSDSCTLAELYAGGTITINDVAFNNWTLNLDDGGLDETTVLVSGVDETSGSMGLNFFADPALSFSFLEYDFDFDISVLGASTRVLTGITLDLLDSLISEDAFVEVNSDLDLGTGFGQGNLLSVTDVLNPPGTDILTDTLALASLTSLVVGADIQMEAFETILPSLSEFEYTITLRDTAPPTVPAPATLLLLLFGGIGFTLNSRKKTRRLP